MTDNPEIRAWQAWKHAKERLRVATQDWLRAVVAEREARKALERAQPETVKP